MKKQVEEVLSKLTLDEKISMLHGNSKFTIAGVPRLGIPAWTMSDGPHGVREEINPHDWDPAGWENDYATYLPVGTALAATWNPELALEVGHVLGREARARRKDIILGPGINIHRTPLCGRNFEYMSEDPNLISSMCVPYIKGVQAEDVAACIKHYAANNQEYERFNVNVEIDERTLREIYLPGFKAAVKEAGVLTVMSAYNKLRGDWCSENTYILTSILRDEWGFEGVVISDWDGAHSTEKAALAGLDIEMGTLKDSYEEYYFADALKQAVQSGRIPVKTIDDKIRHILTSMHRSKVFDKNRKAGEFITKRHFQTARNVAEEAVVLLKNNKQTLPLAAKSIKTLAVIGDNATALHAHGGGSSGVKAKYEISPLEGLKQLLGDRVAINYARGYEPNTSFDWENGRVMDEELPASHREKLRAEAVRVAEQSDIAILFVGLTHHYDMESVDRTSMTLPFEQDELIQSVLKVNPKTIVVLIGGLAVDLTSWIDQVPAVIQGWYAGSEAGNVFAEILFGSINPSGKLPFTFPRKLEDTPAFSFGDMPGKGLEVTYKEGVFVGYRYFDTFGVKPLFAFGHGLSYTTFELGSPDLDKNSFMSGQTLTLTVPVKNTGKTFGSEVVQIYIEDVESSVKRPKKELKAFKKVALKPGESKVLTFEITDTMLSFYDVKSKAFFSEPGLFRIHIGNASDCIHHVTPFTFTGKKNL